MQNIDSRKKNLLEYSEDYVVTINESDRIDGVSFFSNGHQQQHSPSHSALTPAVDFLSSARAERGARGGRVAVVDALGGRRMVTCCCYCCCLLLIIVLLFASFCFICISSSSPIVSHKIYFPPLFSQALKQPRSAP